MESFFNLLAGSARVFSLKPTLEPPNDLQTKTLRPRPFAEPRNPAQVMSDAFNDVGARMRFAMNNLESEYLAK